MSEHEVRANKCHAVSARRAERSLAPRAQNPLDVLRDSMVHQ